MLDTTRIPSRNGRVLAVVAVVTTTLVTAQMIFAGQWDSLLRYSGPLALFLLFVWAALWTPYVECGPGGVRFQNVFSTISVPWPAIQDVDGRFGLTLHTAYGEFTAWSASRPRMRASEADRPSPLNAATAVTSMWTELRKAGHLDNPRLEPDAQPHHWRTAIIELGILFALWTVLTAVVTG